MDGFDQNATRYLSLGDDSVLKNYLTLEGDENDKENSMRRNRFGDSDPDQSGPRPNSSFQQKKNSMGSGMISIKSSAYESANLRRSRIAPDYQLISEHRFREGAAQKDSESTLGGLRYSKDDTLDYHTNDLTDRS